MTAQYRTARDGGQIYILTTNLREQLDAALIRKGRVDFQVLASSFFSPPLRPPPLTESPPRTPRPRTRPPHSFSQPS